MRDASLLELFSLEADAQTQVLSAGLLALERNPTQADQLEACMRAAHSLKGAARIVGVDAGVSVAHVMEDCLVSAQESRLYLLPEHIDALLQGTDLLMRIATPGNTVGPADIEAYVALMERLLDPSQKVAPPAAPPPTPAPEPELSMEALLTLPPEPEPAPPVSAELPRQNKRMTEGGERVLRVTAERLNSLLDLSSKSLVETQRLKPYLASLQRLKRIQNNSARALDNLDGHLKTVELSLEAQEALADTRAIDDCWNRIGIHGDKSCPLLAEHIHCRNCSVYSAAATRLLDRYALQQDDHRHVAAPEVEGDVVTRSLLMFRLGEEWLGIATRCLVEVGPLQPIHSLPHQRSRALLGVANVRGALVACLSLVELLGLDGTSSGPSGGRIMPRMLIIAAQGGPVVVPVDEVDGIHAIDERTLNAASASGTQASARYTQGVLQWKGRSLRWLDEAQLLSAVTPGLTRPPTT